MNLESLVTEEFKTWMQEVLFLVPNWKWIGLVAAIIIGLIIHTVLQRTFFYMKSSPQLTGRLKGFFKHYYDLPTHKPFSWLLTSGFWLICVNALGFPDKADRFLEVLVQLFISVNLIRIVYLGVEAFGRRLSDHVKMTDNTLDDQLAPFITKSLKVVVVVLGVLIVVQNFGINVVSLLAGLGLGGLALALAAQDTAANVFGSVTIIADRPFQVGDHVKVGNFEGTVEEVGFRSTRIRTFYRSLVTIPNSVIAKESIDNLSARSGRRLRHIWGLTYDTPVNKIKAFMEEMKTFIKSHPKMDNENFSVQLTSLGDYSLGILVNCFAQVPTAAEEGEVQQELLFKALTAAESMGVEFAFPTQTQITKNAEVSHGVSHHPTL